MGEEVDTEHGIQLGDPTRAAEVIIAVVEPGRAPRLLVLGADAVRAYRNALEARLASVEE